MEAKSYSKCDRLLYGHTGWIYAIATDAEGKPYSASNDQTIRSFNLEENNCEKVLMGHLARITSIVFSADKMLFFTSSWDRTIRKWSVKDNYPLQTWSGHFGEINKLHYVDSEQILYSASADQTVKKWDVKTGQCIQTFNLSAGTINDIAVSGDIIVSASNHGLQAFDMKSYQVINEFGKHVGDVKSCTLSPCKKFLYSAGYDKKVRVWNLETKQKIISLRGHKGEVTCLQAALFHPPQFKPGTRLWTYEQRTSIKYLLLFARLEANSNCPFSNFPLELVTHIISFLPPSSHIRLYSGSTDGTVREWDLSKKICMRVFERRAVTVQCLHVSAVGEGPRTLWMGCDESQLRSWALN